MRKATTVCTPWIVASLVLAGCTLPGGTRPQTPTPSGAPSATPWATESANQAGEATTVLTASGGTASLADGTSVSIPAGAADAGAHLSVRHVAQLPAPPPHALVNSEVVQIDLTGGLRGEATVHLAAPKPANWPTGVRWQPILAYYDTTDGRWYAADSDFDAASEQVVGQVSHFSTWTTMSFDPQAIADSVTESYAGILGRPSGIPPRCDGSVEPGRISVTVTGGQLVAYCLEPDAGGGAKLKIKGIKNYPLAVSWAGNATQTSKDDYRLDAKTTRKWLDQNWGGVGKSVALLNTGGQVDLRVKPDANAAVLIDIAYDPRTQLAGILDATANVMLTAKDLTGTQTTLEKVWGYAQDTTCFGSSLNQLDQDFVASANTIVVDCTSGLLAEASKKEGAFFSKLGKAPKAIKTMVGTVGDVVNTPLSQYDAGRDLLGGGQTTEAMRVAVPESPTTALAGVWPTQDHEGPSALMVWLGANMYGFPKWVSCGLGYCIVDQGKTVMIVQLDGLRNVGQVPTAVANAVQALTDAGLPENVAKAVAKPGPP